MKLDPIFRHLMHEFYSPTYFEVLGSIEDIIEDCKPKGPLTKSLMELLPKVFRVLEIIVEHSWSKYIDENMESMVSSIESYISQIIILCYVEKETVMDVYDRFLMMFTLVNYAANTIYSRSQTTFHCLSSFILTVFFENCLREDFEEHGGWNHLEKHILNKKYDEYYSECVRYDFIVANIPEDLKKKIRDNFGLLTPSDSSAVRTNPVTLFQGDTLTREVMVALETSSASDSSRLNKEQSVSKEAERSSSSEAVLEDSDMTRPSETDCSVCESQINHLEDKLRQLISIFELLDAE